MFARQISLELELGVGDKHAIARMLTQVRAGVGVRVRVRVRVR